MRWPTPAELVLGGIGSVIAGILFTAGGDIYESLKGLVVSPSLSLQGVLSSLLIPIGIIAIIFGAYQIRSRESTSKPDSKSGYVKASKDRFDVPMEDLLKRVKKEYWNLAVVQFAISTRFSADVLRMVKEGKEFRILIANPEPNSLTQSKGRAPDGSDIVTGEREPEYLKESMGKTIHVRVDPKSALIRMKADIWAHLTPEERELFDVREYNLPITHTLMLLDPTLSTAKARLEVFLYVPREGKQPVFTIDKASEPDLFALMVESFESAYRQSNPVDWSRL